MSNSSLVKHCREIARRFLLTAVVVDDELAVRSDSPVHGELTEPGHRYGHLRQGPADPHPHPPRQLKVDPITRSFTRNGMVCGVVSPLEDQDDDRALAKAVARADIVILDWRLSRKTGATALPLLVRILREDQANRLRLIAFYTGEPDHHEIRDGITASLNSLGATDKADFAREDLCGLFDFRACRIVVYAKPGSAVPDQSAIVEEEDLADRLIADFADKVQGLLPSLVLTALAAVRENVYEILQRFCKDLDPAFLTHRACLPQPADSERHIVEQLASELHGIMDDVVTRQSPAGIESIEHWLKARFGNDRVGFGQGKEMSQTDVLAMLTHGVVKKPGGLKAGGRDYHILSAGFAGGTQGHGELDRRFASAMSFRQVVADTERLLSMGTVVRRIGNGDAKDAEDASETLLCVTPKCDSVRLADKSSFLFLPLSDPEPNTLQVVVPTVDDKHKRMTITMNPSGWFPATFAPDTDRQCVLAQRDGPDRAFTFKDVGGEQYQWVGELKPEFAQSIAQAIAERMSRMPLNKSEWLRRSERSSKR